MGAIQSAGGRIRGALLALLGISTFAAPPTTALTLDSPAVVSTRKALGGQLSPLPVTKLRWYLKDLEDALYVSDTGDLTRAAQLCRAMLRDGFLSGVLRTRTEGILGLPRRFTGDTEQSRALEGRDGARSVFDEMCPPKELAAIVADGVLLGVGVGELAPVEGRDYPVLRRLDPQYLVYRWNENRWYYQSIAGLLAITPGDGRWVLHLDGPFVAPWQHGTWFALGQSWITKQHAQLYKSNWESKLANPARVASSPLGATDEEDQTFFQQVLAWGVNSVFGLKPGYEVKLVESNGVGYQAFTLTISQSEREFMVQLAGQVVTTDGGVGFSNADVHQSIRADLIKSTADAIAYTLNTQVIPQWVVVRWGEESLPTCAAIEFDTRPPKDLKADADATAAFGNALTAANAALQPYGLRVDASETAARFGIALQPIPANTATPSEEELEDESIDVVLDEDLQEAA